MVELSLTAEGCRFFLFSTAYIKDIEKLIKQKIEVVEDNPYSQTEKPMTTVEKKEFEKEKIKRKKEFFASRNKKRPNFYRKKK